MGPRLLRASAPWTAALLAASASLAGCTTIGPPSVPRDRLDYVEAISDSWKRQVLLNLVKMRYADAPVFLDVTTVISSYERYVGIDAAGQVAKQNAGDVFFGVGATGHYTDRPTITYSPLQGDKFARSLMTPLPVAGILLLVQGGYPIDVVLDVCVNSINFLHNASGGFVLQRDGDPRFTELVGLLRQAQREGTLGFESRVASTRAGLSMSFRTPDAASRTRLERIAVLLGAPSGASQFSVSYGSFPDNDTDIALQTRSVLQTLGDLASGFELPASDIAEGRVAPPRSDSGAATSSLHVHSGDQAPADAYAPIRYRERWFWIDDRDLPSKAMLSFVMLLFSLTETGQPATAAPVVTVPTR